MLIQRFIELVTPEKCLGCGVYNGLMCTNCVAKRGVSNPVCFRCGLSSANGRTCEKCRGQTALAGVTVGTYYDGAVKELILRLKFHRLQAAAEGAAALMLAAMPEALPAELVTSVPVSPARFRERGYNQSELLAKLVARRLGLPYRALLGRSTSGHQLGLDRSTRLTQVRGAFFGRRELQGEGVLIVDDVITTGATLSECARVLVESGAGGVWGAAVARH
jgi:competence protein ComFC